ncbi:sigma-70 family RNA polymerase sigma factor [Sediminibacillus dalangtanensis]|uniref:RNA polymerase sigma factor n=1 Tax=Sediminibacillus dalangtanensis TaxID=2729421 RepID=A0ABX7VTG5_9BACI|nr:RNA polymerase sigma factor [Sediminibacillus dalangtanensis]QTM98910.1 sigma-70 family RNA polymerase sigma factor [Sediminibacillus dalangtanensis]
MKEAKTGEGICFEAVYQQYYQRMYLVSVGITKDRCLAEDVVQDAFIKAYKHFDKLRDHDKLGAWLTSIAYRTAIDAIRKEKKRTYVPLEDVYLTSQESSSEERVVEKQVEYKWTEEQIKRQVVLLSPKLRKVFTLKYQNEWTDKEIAGSLRLALGTVKARLYRARKRVKEGMEQTSPTTNISA